jgi:hypothetical protein
MRVLLKGVGGESQAGHAAGRMVLKQAALVGLKKKALNTFPRQEE